MGPMRRMGSMSPWDPWPHGPHAPTGPAGRRAALYLNLLKIDKKQTPATKFSSGRFLSSLEIPQSIDSEHQN